MTASTPPPDLAKAARYLAIGLMLLAYLRLAQALFPHVAWPLIGAR